MAWATAGVLDSPVAGTILADSGAQIASTTAFTILIVTQYSARVEFVWRNALNTSDKQSQLIKTVSDSPTLMIGLGGLTLLLNERVILRAESNMIGEVQASLIW